jgi:hypothetical protein
MILARDLFEQLVSSHKTITVGHTHTHSRSIDSVLPFGKDVLFDEKLIYSVVSLESRLLTQVRD